MVLEARAVDVDVDVGGGGIRARSEREDGGKEDEEFRVRERGDMRGGVVRFSAIVAV